MALSDILARIDITHASVADRQIIEDAIARIYNADASGVGQGLVTGQDYGDVTSVTSRITIWRNRSDDIVDDLLIALDPDVHFRSGLGDDVLYGTFGDDYFNVGAGADRIHGGDGDDLIFFDSGDNLRGGAGYDIAMAQWDSPAGGSI